jgi:cytochrome c oxidase subunit 2
LRVTLATRRAARHAVIVAMAAIAALILASCGARTNDHPTGDQAVPNIVPGHIVTEQGRMAADLYWPVFLIAVGVFVLVEGLVIWIALRYRRRPTDAGLPVQTHGNNPLEVIWTLIPALIVTGLFVLSMSVLLRMDTKASDSTLTVDVTAFQWQWTFEYPDDGLSYTGAGRDGPELVLPVGEPVHIRLHAQDVIHSFYVPQFFYKKDAIPGRTNEFVVTVEEPGTYGGQCAEFCGLAHADMYFTVRALARPEFDAWRAAEIEKANATPPPPPSGRPSGAPAATIRVRTISITEGFDPKELQAPADTPLTVEVDNPDTTAPHNFAIKAANPDGSDWIGLPVVQPGEHATYQAPPLKAGEYQFYCSVHPNMTGTLTVQ